MTKQNQYSPNRQNKDYITGRFDKIDFELYLKSSNFISSNFQKKMASHLETELGKLRGIIIK
jgi:hypothetical protein